ncbi:hypothetical protein L198_04325 [Cryptococcus wingfieldii CBS 7118]|uniref:Ndc10 domain-containing protein n=1 Tax=Cryptococcus wingfieldii CBS 7118 TaxID=1295528 RepID=A0A1E3J4D7_9TREE|nr:hypothetical protein L198_04325 [Cryptococcus wingfieldii CBS 7118]ODN95707.1 hypothetical protein L198_04325 [Cryptococcus wingfieldii CBS 7118]
MSALISLWRHQVDHEGSPYTTPRSSLYSKLLKAYSQLHVRKRQANHEDKGKGSDGDGIQSRKQLADIRQAFFCKGTFVGLRDLAAFDWGHGGLLRGDNQRQLQISDMGVQYFEDSAISDPTPAVAFSCRITSSKTNKNGTMQQVGMFRARDWKVCPVGGQTMYWFSRLHCSTTEWPHSNTPFPNLSQRSHWYQGLPYFTNTGSNTQGISYGTQLSSAKDVYSTAGVQSRLYTHDGRRFGARVAVKSGAPDGQVQRLGLWASDVKDTHYLDVLPEHTMRALAGHPPYQGTFFLARAVQVPRDLMEMVFPMVEEWLDHFSSPGHINSDIEAVQWLKYLKELRLVFIQDIPHWRQLYPEHSIFRHPIFTDPDSPYHAYEKDALASTLSRDRNPPLRDASDAARSQHTMEQVNRNTHRLDDVFQVMQDVLEKVREVKEDVDETHEASLETRMSVLKVQETLGRKIKGLAKGQDQIREGQVQMRDMICQSIIPSLSGPQDDAVAQLLGTFASASSFVSQLPVDGAVSGQASSGSGLGSSSGAAAAAEGSPPPAAPTSVPTSVSASVPTTSGPFAPVVKGFISRKVNNIVDAMTEWETGLAGQPSIKERFPYTFHWGKDLDSLAERKYWEKRRAVANMVNHILNHPDVGPRLVQQPPTIAEAATVLDRWRLANGHKSWGKFMKVAGGFVQNDMEKIIGEPLHPLLPFLSHFM